MTQDYAQHSPENERERKHPAQLGLPQTSKIVVCYQRLKIRYVTRLEVVVDNKVVSLSKKNKSTNQGHRIDTQQRSDSARLSKSIRCGSRQCTKERSSPPETILNAAYSGVCAFVSALARNMKSAFR